MPEHPTRDGYVTATSCPICAAPLPGRADQRYCGPRCRQRAYRTRLTSLATPPSPQPIAARTRRELTVYECSDCGQRLAGEQWCPDCNRPCRRIGPGGTCPSCGDPVTITELIEAPMN